MYYVLLSLKIKTFFFLREIFTRKKIQPKMERKKKISRGNEEKKSEMQQFYI